MTKILLLTIAFIISSSCVSNNRTPQSIESSMLDFLYEAEVLAGKPEHFGQRALLFHWLYLNSGKRFQFALSVSHLSLAIERSLDFGSLKNLPLIKRDFDKYKSGISEMNYNMFIKTYFAYRVTQKYSKNSVIQAARKDTNIGNYLKKIIPIIEPLYEIHRARSRNQPLSQENLDSHYNQFVDWEHRILFQSKIEILLENLSLLEKSLKKVPGRRAERFFLNPIFGIRTTLSLKCFPPSIHPLRTKNFTNHQDRIQQSKEFYTILKSIAFDPGLNCYNDPYYRSHFPSSFFSQTNNFLENTRSQLLDNPNKTAIVHRQSSYAVEFQLKSDPQRLLSKLSSKAFCSKSIDTFWKPYANQFISFPEEMMKLQDKEKRLLAEIESGTLRNAKINQAYLKLFDLSIKKTKSTLPMFWLGSAALGSHSVGKQLLANLYKAAKNNSSIAQQYLKYTKRSQHVYDVRSLEKLLNSYSGFLAQTTPYMNALKKGNKAVFDHIFWQFLTAHYCGPKKVYEYLSSKRKSRTNINAWKKYEQKKFNEANLDLLQLEQQEVLQPVLYIGPIAKYFSNVQRFNHFAQSGIDPTIKPIDSFNIYAGRKGLKPNLSNINSRMNWLNYIVSEHAILFSEYSNRNDLSILFDDVIQQSEMINGFYK